MSIDELLDKLKQNEDFVSEFNNYPDIISLDISKPGRKEVKEQIKKYIDEI